MKTDHASSGSTHLPEDGPAAPPRRNGELVFHAPWQARLFGITLDLVEAGHWQWSDFQRSLIEQIRRDDAQTTPSPSTLAQDDPALQQERQNRYWLQWLRAFESRADTVGLATHLQTTCEELAARPHGHDH